MALLWFKAVVEPQRIDTAMAIQAEIEAIEGRGLPQVKVPLVKLPPPPPDGELAAAIRAAVDTPPPQPPPPPPPGPEGHMTMDHRPPGGGVGMVNTGATIPLFALCLSGGGIRSASFCLGVVQALARVGLLKRFHYLSTVSGGGYTGSLISSLIATLRGVEPAEQALANPQSYPAVDWLARLRNYTSFLAPRLSLTSLDIWAAIALYVRNTLANWVLFLPGLIALALLPRIWLRLVENADWTWQRCLAIPALICLVVATCNACRLVPGHKPETKRPNVSWRKVYRKIVGWLIPLWALLATLWLAARGPDASLKIIPIIATVEFLGGYLIAWAYAAWKETRRPGYATTMYWANLPGWIIATLLHFAVLLTGVYLARFLPADRIALAVLGPAWFVLADLVHASTFAVLRMEARASWMDREWIARLSASEILSVLAISGLAAICLVLPHWLHGLLPQSAGLASVPALLTGPLAAMLGRWTKTSAGGDTSASVSTTVLSLVPTILAVVASVVFLLTLLMGGSALGWRAAAWLTPGCYGNLVWDQPSPCAPAGWLLFVLAVLLFAASWSLGQWVININRFSLHELYRNRLVRAFLGSARDAEVRRTTFDGFTSFNEKDSMRLSEALPHYPVHDARQGLRLFPVINTALNLVSGTRTAWSERKAASFTMTPLHCGSAVLGAEDNPIGAFVPTRDYGGSPLMYPLGDVYPGMQMGTAMTISGAAVSPNAGYHSSATTSFIMALFNARLGAWMPNPAKATLDQMRNGKPPNGFTALLAEMLGKTNDTSPAVYLSDGGHFDNLGLYEMFRRRCQLIVAIDADADKDYAYSDLGDALRKSRIDLGVEVVFPPAAGPVMGVVPGIPFLRAKIHYPAGAGVPPMTGVLLYVKAHMPGTAPADVLAYQSAHTDFPNEPTSNQFFTESQFESYRRLGDHLAS